ncbi:hypothetical protein B4114_2919 [Geobacillus stearothermophilus]|uniref:Uncharacterized protein n=1 Tax=Geobacillus stearothermophilus TaxID=1422 RepID=A0A150NCW0_GEOSE|nr:hypothetical protein B4114_2919 [Geobacillus stearothermophilus]
MFQPWNDGWIAMLVFDPVIQGFELIFRKNYQPYSAQANDFLL